MESIKKFEDLNIWQSSRELNQKIYTLVRKSAFQKDYRFVSQITAAAGSIMDNIAEGFEREGNKEFLQFLFISKGSCGEVQSQLYRAFDCGYITEEEFNDSLNLTKTIGIKIKNFIGYLKSSEYKGTKFK